MIRNISIGFILCLCAVGIIIVVFEIDLPFGILNKSNETPQSIAEKIVALNKNRPSYDKFQVIIDDWKVTKTKFENVNGVFNRWNSWNEFETSLKQDELFVNVIYVDNDNRVVWYVFLTMLNYYPW